MRAASQETQEAMTQALSDGEQPILPQLCKLSALSTLALFADWSRPLLFNLFVSKNVRASPLEGDEAAFEMDCVSMAVMSLNIMAFATAYGFNGGVDSYAPVAFGAKKTIELHLILYRQLILLAILTAIILVLLCHADCWLVLVGQPQVSAERTTELLRLMALSVPGDLVYDCLGHWARSQQRQSLVTVCASIGTLINVSINLLLADPSNPLMGPIAAIVAQNTMLPCMLAFGLFRNGRRPIRAPMASVLDGLGDQLKTGIAQMCWFCAELWAWEVQVFEAAALGAGGAASYALCSSTYSFLIMIPCGVCSALTALVGEALGDNQPRRASKVLWMGCTYGVLMVSVYAIPLSICRNIYAQLVSGGVPAVEERVAIIVPIIMVTHYADGLFNTLKAWLVVRQHQTFGAVQSLLVYYCVGLPLGWWLSRPKDLDVAGLWLGLAVAVVLGVFACLGRVLLDLWELLPPKQ